MIWTSKQNGIREMAETIGYRSKEITEEYLESHGRKSMTKIGME